ncbi:hypothetical protein KAR91_32575 [Candidatus Pacearchaeota archaeon]|nr:hypothetical protein [Candidatus Pacearchaeota archaeon]
MGIRLTGVPTIITDCRTGEQTKSDAIVELVHYIHTKHEKWIHVVGGGVTGYESITLVGIRKQIKSGNGWTACAGTKKVWNFLFFPVASLRQIMRWVVNSETY